MSRPDHEQRAPDAQAQLSKRVQKLIDFIETRPEFGEMLDYDKQLMLAQREAMIKYNHCLVDRIARFR